MRSAIRTDLILSAEIMAITLYSVAASPFWTRVFVLAASAEHGLSTAWSR